MPKILWFGVKLGKGRARLKPRSVFDAALITALGIVIVLLCALPPQPTARINAGTPLPAASPDDRSAANRPKATPAPSPAATPGKGVVITQLVIMDTARAQISVPVIEGMRDEAAQKAINAMLYRDSGAQGLRETAVQHERAPGDTLWEVSLQYAVEQIGRVLHITTYAYTYEGGAHGAEARAEFYIDPQTAAVYTLADLFKEKDAALAAIRTHIAGDIAANPDDYFPDAVPDPLPSTFRIQQDGVALYYPPYAIAPYSEGFPDFLLPWSVLNPFINHDGAFIKALNDRR